MSKTYDIPTHAGAGTAFLGVEFKQTLPLVFGVLSGIVLGTFLHMGIKAIIGCSVIGYLLNKQVLLIQENQLPGVIRNFLFGLGLRGYGALKGRRVFVSGSNRAALLGRAKSGHGAQGRE